MATEPLIFELSSSGRVGFSLPEVDMDEAPALGANLLREHLDLPEVSEIDMTRHFVRLSQKNYSIDTGFYPLGSCTMKYNPKVHEDVAIMPGFAHIHPYQPVETVQGALQVWRADSRAAVTTAVSASTASVRITKRASIFVRPLRCE